jgi:hypothetical protein
MYMYIGEYFFSNIYLKLGFDGVPVGFRGFWRSQVWRSEVWRSQEIQYLNMLPGLFRRYPSNNERLKRSVTYSETFPAFTPVVLLVAI